MLIKPLQDMMTSKLIELEWVLAQTHAEADWDYQFEENPEIRQYLHDLLTDIQQEQQAVFDELTIRHN